MNITEFKSHRLSRKELLLGICYLLFQALFLPSLLHLCNKLLPTPLPATDVNLVFFSLNFISIGVIFRRYLWGQLRRLPEVFWGVIAVAGLGLVAYWVMNFILAQALLVLEPAHFSVNDVGVQQLVAQDYWLMFFSTVFLVPVAEECLFRGALFCGLYDFSPIGAWVVSVAAFCAIHIINYIGIYPPWTLFLCFIQYIPAGICLAGAYRLSGSLICPILLHCLVNFISMMLLR